MFRMCGTIIKSGKILRDITISDSDYTKSRTTMVFHSLTAICHAFDLPEPIWLNLNIEDFKAHAKTKFTSDSFIESIDFDYLMIEIIEE